MSIQKALPNALPELPSEVWLEIFDMVGLTARIPSVCRRFNELHKKMAAIWAGRIVDCLEDCYKEQSPARGIPKGGVVTDEQGGEIIKYFKNKFDAARSRFSQDEFFRYQGPSLSLVTNPESLSTILPIIDENELVTLLDIEIPDRLKKYPRTNLMGHLSTLTTLDLYNKGLLSLPSSFGNLTQLTHLDLSYNKLTTLPDSFGNLTLLTSLYLAGNSLTTLPDSFSNLTQLTMLALYNNRLTTLPSSFSNLTALRELAIWDNPSLAESTQSLSQLQHLRDSGCKVDCDAVVDQAIKALPKSQTTQ